MKHGRENMKDSNEIYEIHRRIQKRIDAISTDAVHMSAEHRELFACMCECFGILERLAQK